MAIDPGKVALFIPPGLKKFKLNLFERIGSKIEKAGGRTVRHEFALLDKLPDDIIPIVGCTPELRPFIQRWRERKRNFAYWDRGYCRRVFATWLPKAESIEKSYYRFHLNSFQAQSIRDVPQTRWDALQTPVTPWARSGSHIVIAAPTATYSRFHGTQNWVAETIDALARVTDRQLVIRDKESKRPLQADLKGAHCLVAHGSIAAVEAVIMGCPVFVHPDSAASLVGLTDFSKIEAPIYPDRQPWLNTLGFCQFNETELVDGTLWRMIE